MHDYLRELIGHQEWADAEHWKALRAFPEALADEDITKRLFHIHLVQAGFLSVILHRPFDRRQFQKNLDMACLVMTVQNNSGELVSFLNAATPGQLNEIVNISWFKDPPMNLPVSRAIMQVTMHSHYHRGQNARRLRELGGEPPTTDFIMWKWKGEPKPDWVPIEMQFRFKYPATRNRYIP